MPWRPREHLTLALYALRWLLIATPVAVLIGLASALFLYALNRATSARESHPALLYFLPFAGIGIAALYHFLGRSAERGNNLIVEQIHEPSAGVPGRMAPLILLTTVLTHLFGGSAGREGTAIQIGGSIASSVGRSLRLSTETLRTLLMVGMAAGFGSVFGTPLAGAVFAMEVLSIGRISYEAIIPCLIAAIVADYTCTLAGRPWGVSHTDYHFHIVAPHLDPTLLAQIAFAAVAFGLVAFLFSELTHILQSFFKKLSPSSLLRPVAGAFLVIAFVHLLGTRDYIGIGVHPSPGGHVSITAAFLPGGADSMSWFWKLLLTAITLSSGFKGGEVTPLFFIGATLGNTAGHFFHVPPALFPLFPAAGFVAVFAGATNTPLACTLMGVELFGGDQAIYLAVACFVAYFFSGHSGIYSAQRIATPKHSSHDLPPDAPLSIARTFQPATDPFPFSDASLSDTFNFGGSPMSHNVHSKEIGQLRIYMPPSERRPAPGLRRKLFGRPLYQEIIDAAKTDGILNAAAHHTHYGYSGNGSTHSANRELPNSSLHLCIELIATRDLLELFCKKHGNLLKDRVIVYKHMEHWEIGQNQIAASPAAQEELDADIAD